MTTQKGSFGLGFLGSVAGDEWLWNHIGMLFRIGDVFNIAVCMGMAMRLYHGNNRSEVIAEVNALLGEFTPEEKSKLKRLFYIEIGLYEDEVGDTGKYLSEGDKFGTGGHCVAHICERRERIESVRYILTRLTNQEYPDRLHSEQDKTMKISHPPAPSEILKRVAKSYPELWWGNAG